MTPPPALLPPRTLYWAGDHVRLLDQRLLPQQCRYLAVRTPEAMWRAIRTLAVRGAPAIGCAAAYGVLLGLGLGRGARGLRTPQLLERFLAHAELLATSRPTAVNLFWALARMKQVATAAAAAGLTPGRFRRRLLCEAHAILREDEARCRAIGRHGLALLPRRVRPLGVLTHCNAGSLAASRVGTALAPIYAAHAAGRPLHVYADETRPLLQGARLTAWELGRAGVPVTLLCDNMAAAAMRAGRIDAVIVGADRIAANGDTANKIGTYGVAVLARHHGIPFYVAAPSSTFDLSLADGAAIPIEERDPDEVRCGFGRRTAPAHVPVWNPAFDVTPAALIAAIVTERGLIRAPTEGRVRAHLA
jgi:methylthioribose-1-phosphate isomerase